MFERIPFSSFGEFLNMGGYAFNVWTVYLLFVIFLLVNLLGPRRRRKQLMKELERRAVLAERQQPDSSD
ncbi:MAG: heme exporter protein CcmD [Gammaproteobacteria bacterium]|nr:heme exporter protein CcmD [Pseudomonadales bacterium]MCP5345853.1 heme exporter protein CcmD [Pseudomonadales bacterium]